ncbi:MAG TPA: hypothetical protein VFR81_07590, partial [Longimicrobium sp.]|nr:hypothetical protein [Longimicrobium sp.]
PGTETPTQTTLPLDGQGGEEGSDFELWFWIESPRTTGISGGTATTGTVVGGRTGGTIVRGAGGTELKGAPSAGAGPETVTLAALELPQTLRAGEQGQGTLRLSGPAPKGGFTVALSSSDKGVAVDEKAAVPAGKTEAPFRLDASGARAGSRATITATTDAGALQKRIVIAKA